ncbi:hypothetical protein QBC45DRAFT_483311 [Copromyces sp. CBS 386.78]|nr:hypothetical protein QBC45DRAFT_483311 [Copromyces sp. CBS 386.78]
MNPKRLLKFSMRFLSFGSNVVLASRHSHTTPALYNPVSYGIPPSIQVSDEIFCPETASPEASAATMCNRIKTVHSVCGHITHSGTTCQDDEASDAVSDVRSNVASDGISDGSSTSQSSTTTDRRSIKKSRQYSKRPSRSKDFKPSRKSKLSKRSKRTAAGI